MTMKSTTTTMKRTRTTIINQANSYCSQKFWWLTVDIEKMQSLSCCAATPSKINLEFLKTNPGDLFNTPELIDERKQMLLGTQVKSCQSTCWIPESNNISSRRLEMGSNQLTHTNIQSQPEVIHLVLSSNCNMTCVYCCKQYSTAWKQDIINNGTYSVSDDNRYTVNDRDKILLKLSQQDIVNSKSVNILTSEINLLVTKSPNIRVTITGGEPFLYHDLDHILDNIPDSVPISLWTGLGVNKTRFNKILNQLKNQSNLEIVISAENIKELYEFNRYGNTWEQFNTNLNTLKDSGLTYRFNATISNLTLFGLVDFYKYVNNDPVSFQSCTDPDFLSINVLDDDSKKIILDTVDQLPIDLQNLITNSIGVKVTDQQYTNFSNFVREFSNRRKLKLDMFPQSLINWINCAR